MKIITENIFKNTSLNQVIVTLALAFVFIMNVSEKISTLLLVTLFVVSLFNIKNFDIQKFKPVSVLIVLFSIYIATHFLMDEVFSIKTIEKRFSLVALPIIFSVLRIDKKAFYAICKFFVLGVILGCFLNLLEPFVFDFDWSTFTFNEIPDKKKIIFKGDNYWMNHFYSVYFSNFMDRSYYGVYLSLAIAAVWHVLNWKMMQKLLWMLFFVIHIFLSNSLMGILGLGAVVFFAILKMRKAYLLLAFPLFFVLAALLSPRFSKYISQTWTYMNDFDAIPKDFLRYRWEMWKASVQLISEQPLWGYGKEGFDVAFNARIHKNVGWSYNILNNVGFNSHNQYLQVFGEAGIFGFLAYLAVIITYIVTVIKQKATNKYLKFTFIALIIIFSFSETVLNRYIGISFFTFFYCFFLVKTTEEA
ncbi:O-antigen ligase family protein [Kordia zhangzhouensis]|uniref:O-antigen ligase family protein n=1 Tax=Kordia zhangzhouensis TaxID=1620405 RepID=UPI0009E62127|nr:O-antigen ligase family protein [Kordia zhangzhouensis]